MMSMKIVPQKTGFPPSHMIYRMATKLFSAINYQQELLLYKGYKFVPHSVGKYLNCNTWQFCLILSTELYSTSLICVAQFRINTSRNSRFILFLLFVEHLWMSVINAFCNIWRTQVLFMGSLIPCFGLLVTSTLGFKTMMDNSHACYSNQFLVHPTSCSALQPAFNI